MITHTAERPTFASPAAEPHVARPAFGALVALLATLATLAAIRWARTDDAAPTRPEPIGIVASLGLRTSHDGRYRAEIVSTTSLVIGAPQSWTLQLTRRGHRRVSGARVSARTWSPETRERSPLVPTVRYVGGSRYRIDDVHFPHAGWWNVALVIDAATGVDSVAFNVVIPVSRTRDTR